MRYLLFSLFSLSFITLVGCTVSSGLPGSRPTDLEIVLHEDGGMLPNSRILTLNTQGTSNVFERNDQEETTTPITITDEEMDTLYNILKENHFDTIKTSEDETTDRGGTSVWVSWGQQSIRLYNTGGFYVNKKDITRYENIVDAIQAFVATKLP